MAPMNADETMLNENHLTEGDINRSEARKNWIENEVDQPTRVLLEKDARYFLHQSLSTPCLDVINNCQGPYIENISGKKYLDFHGNNVHQLGFSHPKIIARLTDQLQGLTFSTRRYTNEVAINFAEKLVSLLPADLNRILMTPNGGSCIGIALKLARAITGKYKVVSFWDSFHGASLEAISVGGEAMFRQDMGPLLPGTERIPPPTKYRGLFEDNEAKCLEYLEYVFAKEGDIGAFLAETIRNTDVQIPSKNFWKQARSLCDQYGVLLILDEIPIALGRTGHMFAFGHFGIVPDILCLGKGIGGGIMPQAVMVTRDRYNNFGHLSLGHYTHEKSPMGAMAGLTVLEILEEENLLEKAKTDGMYMKSVLSGFKNEFPLVGDVRGIGLLWGIELVNDRKTKEKAVKAAEKVMYACLKEGLNFKVSAGNVIQLSPPLNCTTQELTQAMAILHNALSDIN